MNKDAVPFSCAKLTKRPVFGKNADDVEFYFEHFWDSVQASFLIDFHRLYFGLDLHHWLDWDEVKRVACFLDGPVDGHSMGSFNDPWMLTWIILSSKININVYE